MDYIPRDIADKFWKLPESIKYKIANKLELLNGHDPNNPESIKYVIALYIAVMDNKVEELIAEVKSIDIEDM